MAGPRYSKGSLPSHPDEWDTYSKHGALRAVRIEGPFEVLTPEGAVDCADGYLTIDDRGIPYPVEAEEFERDYRPVEPADADDQDEG